VRSAALIAVLLLGRSASASAENATATIAVSVSVLPACVVSGAPVAFGTYIPMSTGATGTGSGSAQNFPVYARILPTSAPAGTYSDNVTIVVIY
jgi:spore coat protein U-like protein